MSSRLFALFAIGAIVLVPAPRDVRAVIFTSTGDGDWTLGTTWDQTACAGGCTAGVDYPGTGDSAIFGASTDDITVSSAEVFSGGTVTAGGGGQSPRFEITTGNMLTLDGGTFDVANPTGDFRINGAGTFINSSGATFEVSNAGIFYLGVLTNKPMFRNEGTVELSSTGSFSMFDGDFTNKSGGIIRGSGSGTRTVNNHVSGTLTPLFTAESGSILEAADAGTILRFNIDNTNNTALGNVTDVTFQGDGEIEFEGYYSEISGTISGNVSVQLYGTSSTEHYIPTGGTVYNVTGNTNGLEWIEGNMDTQGNTATNQGIMTLQASAHQINGGGTFTNATGAEFRLNASGGAAFDPGVSGGVTFNNEGTFSFLDNSANATVRLFNGSTFNNAVGGVLRNDVAFTSNFNDFADAGASFNNLGTVEVTAGEIQIDSNVDTTSVGAGGTELTQGTWNVLSGAGTATIDLQAGGTSAGSIVTIGSTASVLMGGNNPVFSQISGGSLTVNGSFGVQNQYIHTLSGSLTAPGTLLFGLEAADVGGTLLTGLDITGNVDFTGGVVDINDLGDMVEGTYRLIDWDGTRTGFLTLGNVPNNGFVYELVTMDTGSGFVNLEVSTPQVPEPGTALLLALGLVGMSRHIRQRRKDH